MSRNNVRKADADLRHARRVKDALRSIERRARRPGERLHDHADLANWFRLRLCEYEHEVFAAAWLDNRGCLIAFEELFRGTLAYTPVPVRELVRAALRQNAAAVFFAHNHPSGNSCPSCTDLAITRTIKHALDLIDVRVFDHFVVTTLDPPEPISAHDPSALDALSIGYIPLSPRGKRPGRKPRNPKMPKGRAEPALAAVAETTAATPSSGVAAERCRRQREVPA
jgi:DNA repair protein RadC